MSNLPPPDIVAERGACLVINKPGGLLTQGPPGIDSLELRIKQYLKVRDEKPGKVYLGVPHRLDRPASGIMVFAKNVRAAKRLADQFQQRSVEKMYWAVVQNGPDEDTGTWVDFMRKLPDEAKSEICDQTDQRSKRAVLHYRVRARAAGLTWLQIQLETGRTHQIRLQCSSRGFPILGDQLYDSEAAFGPATLDHRKRWIALHARQIAFEHPMEKTSQLYTAPVSEHWHELDFEIPDDRSQQN